MFDAQDGWDFRETAAQDVSKAAELKSKAGNLKKTNYNHIFC